ncbi:MAG TPA: phosphatidylglycerol lysyltransferase domain-containing protein [Chitinispirillaceae bacterium]|nr:phosphatidylglycerol lysyltransferase domain-containing protein [Chitinispirillaceae bacterium]
MSSMPLFPHFKPLELTDREVINSALWLYQPETSDLTFTNLFMWRRKYHYQWCMHEKWLFLIAKGDNENIYALEPVGPPSRFEVTLILLKWLDKQSSSLPVILRADKRMLNEVNTKDIFETEPIRDHFDYLYSTTDLITLSGRHYHSKRNHLKRFFKDYQTDYQILSKTQITKCLDFSSRWCQINHCKKDTSLYDEHVAISEAFIHFDQLQLNGAALYIKGEMVAFTLGELLNNVTAVIHVEKAFTEFHGIYAAINQLFCANRFNHTSFINREQDLGDDGLRKAKLSYNPVRLVEKFRIKMKSL